MLTDGSVLPSGELDRGRIAEIDIPQYVEELESMLPRVLGLNNSGYQEFNRPGKSVIYPENSRVLRRCSQNGILVDLGWKEHSISPFPILSIWEEVSQGSFSRIASATCYRVGDELDQYILGGRLRHYSLEFGNDFDSVSPEQKCWIISGFRKFGELADVLSTCTSENDPKTSVIEKPDKIVVNTGLIRGGFPTVMRGLQYVFQQGSPSPRVCEMIQNNGGEIIWRETSSGLKYWTADYSGSEV